MLSRIFIWAALLIFIWTIAEALIFKISPNLPFNAPNAIVVSIVCLLFSIAFALQQLLEKEK